MEKGGNSCKRDDSRRGEKRRGARNRDIRKRSWEEREEKLGRKRRETGTGILGREEGPGMAREEGGRVAKAYWAGSQANPNRTNSARSDRSLATDT